MAISVVSSSGQGTTNGATITLNYTSAANDQLLVINAQSRTGTAGTVASSNGTSFTQVLGPVTTGNLSVGIWKRVALGVETTATCSGSGNAQDGVCSGIIVLRGCADTTFRISSGATGTSTNPNSPVITCGSTAAVVVSLVAQISSSALFTVPSGYTGAASASASDNRSTAIGISSILGSEQTTEDPGVWVFTQSAAWIGVSAFFSSSNAVYFTLPPPLRDPYDGPGEMIRYEVT